MIVPMKKIYLVVQKTDTSPALQALGRLGIVHVEHLRVPAGDRMNELKSDGELLEKVIALLSAQNIAITALTLHDWKARALDILGRQEEIETISERVTRRAFEIQRWEPWGHFEPQDIQRLAGQGFHIQLCEVPVKQVEQLPKQVIVQLISTTGKTARCLILSREKVVIPFPAMELPVEGLNTMKALQAQDQQRQLQLQEKIRESTGYLAFFRKQLDELQSHFQLETAAAGMGEEQSLVYLKGYCPVDACEALTATAKHERWGLLIQDTSGDDVVPTLVRNPRWVEMIKPVFEVINIVPGYKEKDISLFFLLFFSIFFSMLVGDAGYGTIFLLLTIFTHKKFGARLPDKSVIFLLYLLSACTIIWGVLTGTAFGTLLFGQTMKPVLPWLTEARNLQFICFLLGVIHLSIAHVWRCITRGLTIGALAEIGWIMALWGSFFLANMMLIGNPMPGFTMYLYIVGTCLIVADIIAQKKDVGVNMILFVFSMINTFGDIVSYIRLFAVGLAGVAVADAFNQMALGIGFGNIFTSMFALFILAFVHLFLNLALCVMGVLVHGVRLNVLEFSGHLGMEWSGIKYSPLMISKHNK